MITLAVAVWLTAGLVLGCCTIGPRLTMVWTVLASICLYPQALTAVPAVHHVGMAPVQPQLRTYGVVLLLVGVGAALSCPRAHLPVPFLLLAGWLTAGLTLWWSGSAEQWSGVLQLTVAVAAWCAGSALGRIDRDGAGGRALALVVAGIVAIQCVVGLMQLAGVPINALDSADASILGNRVNGTSNHPNNLGKMIVLLLMLLLPLTRAADRFTRRVALTTTVLALLPLVLAQGRANFSGALMMIVLWAALAPRGRDLGARVWLMVGAGLLGLASAGVFLARFDEDPNGGARGRLLSDAMRYLPEFWRTGMGPNSYVTVMSPRTGSYIPVHNSFVLTVAELGVVGALLLLLPLVLAVARAYRHRRRLDAAGDAARSLLSSAPAVLVIAMTGWGLMGTGILPLWFFAVAMLDRQARHEPGRPADALLSAAGEPSPPRAGSAELLLRT